MFYSVTVRIPSGEKMKGKNMRGTTWANFSTEEEAIAFGEKEVSNWLEWCEVKADYVIETKGETR